MNIEQTTQVAQQKRPRKYLPRVGAILASIVLTLILIGSLAGLLGSLSELPAPVTRSATKAETTMVLPLRAISVPFGISSVLTLTQDGKQISTTGHGVCWEEGQMFDLHVRVAQSTTNAFAEGHTIDICAGGARQMWDAEAAVASQPTFEVGNARACAEATEFAQHGIGAEYSWCKDVELTQLDSGSD